MSSKSMYFFHSFLFMLLILIIQNGFAQDITNTVTSNGKYLIKDDLNRSWLDIQRGKYYFRTSNGVDTLFEVLESGVRNKLVYSGAKFSVQTYTGLNIFEVALSTITNRLNGTFAINNTGDTPLFEISNTSGAKFYLNNIVFLDLKKSPGSISLGRENRPTGVNSICMGYNTTASGEKSISIGDTAVASGKNSISIGKGSTASGELSIAIGLGVEASGLYSTALGQNVSTNLKTGSFIIGDATGVTSSTADNQMMMRFHGGYILYSNSTATFGVSLGSAGNSWSSISDSTKKEKFLSADDEYFLNSLSDLRLGSWNYKNQDPENYRHYGPMAQDIFHYFGKDKLGTIGNDTTLATADMDGIMMICLQALEKRTSELKKENEQLRTELNDLKEIKEELAEFRNLKEELSEQIKILKAINESESINVGFMDN